MQFVLEEHHRNVSTDELIEDVRRVAKELGKESIMIEEYDGLGKYHHTTIRRRIGSWKEILLQADLSVEGHNFYISDEEYLADLKFVAETLKNDTVTSLEYKLYGKYGSSKLSNRFGNWKRALENFIQYINDDADREESDSSISSKENNEQENATKEYRHKTKRDVNLRLRFLVMKRDNFKCCMCGASPTKKSGSSASYRSCCSLVKRRRNYNGKLTNVM